MDKQWFKEAYLRLPSADRQEIARWILDLELGPRPSTPPPTGPRRPFPQGALLGLLFALLLGGASWGLFHWQKEQTRARAAETASERDARERSQPQSPKNLEFIQAHLGQEITIRGVPEDFDVGYLYFSIKHSSALRLSFFVNNVVLLQSGELEELVKQRQELQVTGTVSRSPKDDAYEINVSKLGQLKKLGTPP